MLLGGGDPAAWPNAELALAPCSTNDGAPEPRVVGPNPCAELDGVGARAQRYRHELETGRWTLAAGWTDLIAQSPNPRGGPQHDPTT